MLLVGVAMVSKTGLKKYQQRRNLKESGEPAARKKSSAKSLIFVIQKHASSHLHYDFRLEIDGVLKSWAVPKGPSLDPRVKRLALPTDDHPYDYATFEGVIPEGNYGAGTVMVWDKGTYKNIKEKDGTLVPLSTCYDNGHLEFFLKGKKLKGAFTLVRTGEGNDERWLLIKMRDEYADARRNPVSSEPDSAKTGRSMKEIEQVG